MSLVKTDVEVTGGSKINDQWYWVSTKKYLADAENSSRYQSWSVNVSTKKTHLMKERITSFPAVKISTDPYSRNFGYVTVVTEQGWEGISESYLDVIDKDTLLASVRWQNIQPTITTERDGSPTHTISFAPAHLCEQVKTDTDVQAIGLLVDQMVIPFKHPQTVRCAWNDMLGVATLPEFGQPSFSRSDETLPHDLVFLCCHGHSTLR